MTPYRSQLGITAIELMATLLIVAVLAAIAIPNFVGMIRNDRARAQASMLADALNYARSEAVTRGFQVGVSSASGDNNWDQGWRVWSDKNGDGSYVAGTDIELRVQSTFTGNATLQNGNIQVLFSPSGALAGRPVMNASNELVFQYRVNNNDCSLGKDIHVNLVGRIFLDKQAGCP
ncbi:MAG: fimT [Verrucomicrobiaceae bacterium]|nr:fimT [Verrucomicrobiaceae bacterium]